MLTHKQIITLANIGKLKIKCCDSIPIAVSPIKYNDIIYPYEDFKREMGLDDLRLNWLLGKNNMIAGGSVLNWIWGEKTNGDIDFFFRNEESADIFTEFIKGIGFKLVKETGYALTYFEQQQGLILQVVGNPNENPYIKDNNFIAYGTPQEIIENFDIYVCKFAVDSDYVYTTSRAIQDLLKMTVDYSSNEKRNVLLRLFKYVHKGFYPSSKIKRFIKYDEPIFMESKNTKWI